MQVWSWCAEQWFTPHIFWRLSTRGRLCSMRQCYAWLHIFAFNVNCTVNLIGLILTLVQLNSSMTLHKTHNLHIDSSRESLRWATPRDCFINTLRGVSTVHNWPHGSSNDNIFYSQYFVCNRRASVCWLWITLWNWLSSLSVILYATVLLYFCRFFYMKRWSTAKHLRWFCGSITEPEAQSQVKIRKQQSVHKYRPRPGLNGFNF